MKQTILSKCFGKMKRVALALFAVLCVSSAIARGVFWSRPPEISVSPDGLITVKSGSANNYTWSQGDSGHNKATYDAAVNGLTCEDRLEYTLVTTEGETITREIIVKEAYSVTNVGWHGPTLNVDYTHQIEEWGSHQVISVSVTYKAILNKSVSSTINYENKQNRDKFIYSGYDFEMSGVLSTSCTWDNSKNCFVVLGNAIADSVRVQYVLGGMDLTTSSEFVESKTVSTSGNEYRIEIPYTDERKLIWRVYAIEDGSESLYVDNSQKSVFEKTRWDNSRVTYTWQGGPEEGNWTDSFNWSTDASEAWGYPGTKGESYYCTFVRFESDAVVDLNKGEYTLIDGGASLYFAPGANVILKDGNLGLNPQQIPGGQEYKLGGPGATVEYKNLKLIYAEGNSGGFNLSFAAGSTNIFSGSIDHPWNYLPTEKGTKVVFKDGEIKTEYSKTGFSNLGSHEFELNNAKWEIKVNNSSTYGAYYGIAGVVKFRDGVDRQAQLKVNGDKPLKLQGTYDFILSSNPYTTPYVEAGKAHTYVDKTSYTTYKCNIKVDATALDEEAEVPLMKFTEVDNYTEETMAQMVDPANKYLKVIVDGKEVDNSKYGASLVWKNNILYYQQTEPKVAAITKTETDDAGNETEVTTEYVSLEKAIAEANGDTIKLIADIEAPTAFVIGGESGAKTVTIDLNGKTVKANDTAAATDGNGVFWVQAGGVLTLEDSSEAKTGTVDGNGGNDYKMAIWADGGKVVINAGNYVNDNDGTHTQYDLIYVKNGGLVEINGGTFKCDSPRWTLNSHNTQTGTFVVTGGKFYQYNPTDFDTDEAVTTWCDAKYRAEADGDWYVIKEGYTVTEESAATVTADTEAEALAQVDFSVTTPEGVDATAYKNYFKLVATETAEGSKTWIVALALKDELKPVIAETTPAITFNEDGTVTVNIENELPGLNYGVRYATTVEAVETATPVAGFTVTPAEGDTAGFFKVVVDFKEIK